MATNPNGITPADRVLLAILSTIGPSVVSPSTLSDITGLTTDQIYLAYDVLVDEGRLGPGARASRRADVLVPDVLSILSLGQYSIGLTTIENEEAA